jgi:O-Antigen ligase
LPRLTAMAASDALVFRARAAARGEVRPTALVLACALPIVFLHVNYQPGVSIPVGSTDVAIELSDIALLAVAVAALEEARRTGLGVLRAALPLWVAAAALLGWILVRSESLKHAVTGVKFAEYAVLALAVPLLLRRRADWQVVLAVVAAWSAIATLVGLAQFFGVHFLGAWPAARRQPSFLGHSDFAALSALAFGGGLATLVLARRRIGWVPIASGAVGVVLAGATAGAAGLGAATLVFLLVARRRHALGVRDAVLSLALVGIVSLGVLALRAGDYDQFFRFLHIKGKEHAQPANVQTYAHHTLLAYIGYRIWRAHPVVGSGWQGSTDASVVDPQLPAARRKFPDVAPLAFPTPAHEWGVQDAYVQAAADLGAIGFVLWLLPFATALVLAFRASGPLGAVASFVVVAAAGLWAGQGLVAGLPLDAVTWLGFGLAATAAQAGG